MPVRKLVYTLQIEVEGLWRLIPGSWPTREAAEAAFEGMRTSLQRRDQTPTSHKIVASMR